MIGWRAITCSRASGLAAWLEDLALDPADFYGSRGVSFTALLRELGWLGDAPHPEEERLSRAIGSALLHLDDDVAAGDAGDVVSAQRHWRRLLPMPRPWIPQPLSARASAPPVISPGICRG